LSILTSIYLQPINGVFMSAPYSLLKLIHNAVFKTNLDIDFERVLVRKLLAVITLVTG